MALKIDGSAGSSHVWTYEAENSPAIYAPFEVVADSTASNGYCVTSSTSLTGPPTAPPQSMRFDTEASGTVNIWLRGESAQSVDRFVLHQHRRRHHEHGFAARQHNGNGTDGRKRRSRPARDNTLGFNVREVGTSIDQVLITDDLNFTP